MIALETLPDEVRQYILEQRAALEMDPGFRTGC